MSTINKDDVKAMIARDPLAVYRAGGLQLKKAGGGLHKCPCPFHKEKTASFTVYEKDGGFKCFGGSCGIAGDAIRFIQQKEGLSFADALTRINSIYGGGQRINTPPVSPPPSSPAAPQARLEAFPIPAAAALESPVPAKYKGFIYHDRNGNPVLWKFRKDRSPQWFDGKRLQKKGFPCRPLFNLPALLKNNGAKPIIIAEGEPATAALIEAGFLATTSVGEAPHSAKPIGTTCRPTAPSICGRTMTMPEPRWWRESPRFCTAAASRTSALWTRPG